MDGKVTLRMVDDDRDEERQPLNAMVTENLKHIIIRRIYGDGADKGGSAAAGGDVRRRERSTVHRQYFASAGPIIASMSSGMCAGFSAVLLPQLQAEESEIQITKEEGSWIASMLALPLALGCLFSGYVMDILGRKFGQIACCIPLVIGCLVLAFAPNVPVLYIGRFLTGFCVGLIAPIVQVFIAEVSEPKHRGILLAGPPLTVSLGIFLSHILGTYLSWRLTAGLCAVPPLVSMIILPFVPETPAWLLQRKRTEDAEKSFHYYRGRSVEALKELNGLLGKNQTPQEEEDRKAEDGKSKLTKLTSPSFFKPFLVLSFLFFVQQFSGVNAVAFYSVTLLRDVLTIINGYTGTIIIDVARFAASVLSIILLKRYGRKSLTIISAVGTAVSLFALAGYLAYFRYATEVVAGEESDLDADLFNETIANSTEVAIADGVDDGSDLLSYLPLIFLIMYISFVTLGLVPVPWVLAGELFSKDMRGIGSGGTTCFGFICFFTVVKTSPDALDFLGIHGTFCLFGAVSLIGSAVTALFLPETKDKTLAEIEAYYKGKPDAEPS